MHREMDLLMGFLPVPALYPAADIRHKSAGNTEQVGSLYLCPRIVNNVQRVLPPEEPEDLALFVRMDGSLRPPLHLPESFF